MIATTYPVLLWLAFSSQAGACFYCFSSDENRFRICQYFIGYANKQNRDCQRALWTAFQPFEKIQVGAFEKEKLEDIFARIIFYLEEKGMASVPYHQAIPEAVEIVRKELEELRQAPACIPPCGFQKEGVSFECSFCRLVDCQLPIDCPIQDIRKREGDITVLRCTVKFPIPPERIIKWKFSRDLRTQDNSFFEDISVGADASYIIRPTTGAHRGTYACEILERDDVLVRKFIYLNVTLRRLGKEKELQDMFHDILSPPPGVAAAEEVEPISFLQDLLREPDSLFKTSVLLFLLGLALSSMLVTLLLTGLYYWATDEE